ncbi:S8 family serine peptidase [Bradyrhizobium guangzhouense]|uniref:S8 family serine peptidase n=1 Tax=Bradyrhizobium guangzhouense TaxID=1325095 RepID=UPI0010098FA0|nr:S8 family serine peptidase [Bradyrhizobium guangzhouense]RXH14748.1 peptidase S8 [Bradyrhizobium guangzhouense]
MARRATRSPKSAAAVSQSVSASADELMLAALDRGGDVTKTGRFLVTFKESAADAGIKSLSAKRGLRVADARDFTNQSFDFAAAGDAGAMVFSEIGVALVGGDAAVEHGINAAEFVAADAPAHSVDPEYFMFATQVNPSDYLRGVLRTAEMIAEDLGTQETGGAAVRDVSAAVAGATWGLSACRVPPSHFDANGIKVAVLDTGFDLGHPEFAGRSFVTNSFVGQPVQDLHGHGTHTAGTACGPASPPGPVPRYGIGARAQIFIGKVLTNSGGGTQAQVLAGMNWAISNRCAAISMSLGAQIPVQPSYTAAGNAALNAGCLIIAASGNASSRPWNIQPTGAPANSPSVVSVAALDSSLRVAVFSNGGKVDIAGPGVNVFSSWPRPTLHNTISGTSMATPHVAGCAALWAQTSQALRGAALRAKLLASARHLPLPATDVGAGLVQAP